MFLTNIKWLKDTAEVAGGVHATAASSVDIFGGYKIEIVQDVHARRGLPALRVPALR